MAEEREHRTEDEVLEEHQGVDDLGPADSQQSDIAGGTVSGSEREDRLADDTTADR